MASLTALASTISTETEKLAKYIKENDLPDPSFAVDGPASFPVPVENTELQSSRMALMRAAEDLSTLALGPVESLRWQAWNVRSPSLLLVFALRHSNCLLAMCSRYPVHILRRCSACSVSNGDLRI